MSRRVGAAPLALAIVSIAGALVGFAVFRDRVFEDAYITFRYAQNLAQGRGLSFNPGEAVLGTSSPLWALLLGAAGACGADIELAADFGFALGSGLCAYLGGRLLAREGAPGAGVLFALAIAFGFGGLHAWWGLETPSFVAVVLAAWHLCHRRRFLAAGLAIGAASLLRHEGAAFAAALLAGLLARGEKRTTVARYAGAALAVVLPWILFAWWRYGSPIPHTVVAKASGASPWQYLARAMADLPQDAVRPWKLGASRWLAGATAATFGLGALAGIVDLVRRRSWGLDLVAGALLTLGGLALVAPGPQFGWHRFPVLVPALFASCLGWSRLLPRAKASVALSPALLALLPPVLLAAQRRLETDPDELSRASAYQRIGEFLTGTGLAQRSVLTAEPGFLAYRTGVRVIDAAGLVTLGVRVAGAARGRTSLEELLAREPEMILARVPFAPPGYTSVFEAHMGRRLLLRDDLARLSRARLEEWYAADEPCERRIGDGRIRIGSPASSGSRDRRAVGDIRARGSTCTLRCAGRERTLTAESEPFRFDADGLEIEFAGTHAERTLLQLVIRGRVVLQAGGAGLEGGREPVLWDVRRWRDRAAIVRAVLVAGCGDALRCGPVRARAFVRDGRDPGHVVRSR